MTKLLPKTFEVGEKVIDAYEWLKIAGLECDTLLEDIENWTSDDGKYRIRFTLSIHRTDE